MAEPALKDLTFDELEALEDWDGLRYELWGGEPVAMTGGTPAHNLIALALARTIYPQLKGTHCRVFMADVGLRLGTSTRSNKAYPDVMIVCNLKPEAYQTEPVLVAEVLSESSVGRDRNTKFKAYKSLATVQVYLILSQTAVEIEVYRRASGWAEEVFRGGEAVIELAQPLLLLPLRAIYEDVWDDLIGGNTERVW